ncbi:MAG TPA: NADH-quinone oxidoreductase subunit D [Candidatus Thermoplasmatota archaeon]|jgi:NADH:ubiquinone oxidoreductase subunit D|nr:NADH-quinone oxidoreductase subunit D [Candidatus Thermoplasmatota archaeon]
MVTLPPKAKTVMVNMGPQHPSTHGVLRLKVVLNGEIVEDVEPVMGYLHRGSEKLAEDGTYLQWIPYTDRLDYLAAMQNNMAYVLAVETVADIKVPEYADYLRVIAQEINRIASHQVWLGTWGIDLGALTMFFWCIRDREEALALLELMCGARLTYSYMRFGGVVRDVPPGFRERALAWVQYMRPRIDEYEALLTKNDIFLMRTKGIGRLSAKAAMNFGVTGPMARASGIDFDLRRDEPYGNYAAFDFDVPVRKDGDCFARYEVRVEEMRQSCDILDQALQNLPERGPYIAPEVGERAKQNRVKPPAGEVYVRVENPRGEVGCFLVSDGSNKPYRVKWRPPSLSNLHPLRDMVVGLKIPDLIATLGSTDITLGDVDR